MYSTPNRRCVGGPVTGWLDHDRENDEITVKIQTAELSCPDFTLRCLPRESCCTVHTAQSKKEREMWVIFLFEIRKSEFLPLFAPLFLGINCILRPAVRFRSDCGEQNGCFYSFLRFSGRFHYLPPQLPHFFPLFSDTCEAEGEEEEKRYAFARLCAAPTPGVFFPSPTEAVCLNFESAFPSPYPCWTNFGI